MTCKQKPTQRAVPADKHVGQRIRLRRALCGMSQEALAKHLGVTFQQLQKYERGINRVSAGRLYEVSQALQVPVSYFYEGLEGVEPYGAPSRSRLVLETSKRMAALPPIYQVAASDMVKTLERASAAEAAA